MIFNNLKIEYHTVNYIYKFTKVKVSRHINQFQIKYFGPFDFEKFQKNSREISIYQKIYKIFNDMSFKN